jgi:hypothetical protein
VNKVTYKTPDYMLCSAQDYSPGESGYQQHIWQATLGPEAVFFVTHPPCLSEEGSHRPNFWHGNVVLPRVAQWKDALIAIHKLPDDDWLGFTHAYFPVNGMDEFEIRDRWAFGKVNDGYIALGAANGLDFQKRGDNAYRDLRSTGTPNVWLCQMGRAALDGSFQEFIAKVLALPVQFDFSCTEFTTLRGDQLCFGWQGSFLVNGEVQPLNDFKHYDSPYCTCELKAPVMEIQHAGDILRLHFQEEPKDES